MTDIDFSYLEKLDCGATEPIEYPIYGLEGNPVLLILPATQSNKAFFNATLKGSRKNLRSLQTKNISSKTISETRDVDRELYSKHIVKGWRNICDTAGNQVVFSEENIRAFLSHLPDWMFDDLRHFAQNPENFVEGLIDTEEIAKN